MFAYSSTIWDMIHSYRNLSQPASEEETKISGYILAESIA